MPLLLLSSSSKKKLYTHDSCVIYPLLNIYNFFFWISFNLIRPYIWLYVRCIQFFFILSFFLHYCYCCFCLYVQWRAGVLLLFIIIISISFPDGLLIDCRVYFFHNFFLDHLRITLLLILSFWVDSGIKVFSTLYFQFQFLGIYKSKKNGDWTLRRRKSFIRLWNSITDCLLHEWISILMSECVSLC